MPIDGIISFDGMFCRSPHPPLRPRRRLRHSGHSLDGSGSRGVLRESESVWGVSSPRGGQFGFWTQTPSVPAFPLCTATLVADKQTNKGPRARARAPVQGPDDRKFAILRNSKRHIARLAMVTPPSSTRFYTPHHNASSKVHFWSRNDAPGS